MRHWATVPADSAAAADREAPPPPPAWVEALALGIPLIVLAGLSLYQLGTLSLWRDEVVSVAFASAPVAELLAIVGRQRDQADLANMAVYYLLLHFWLGVGHDEGWVRLLSVIFGVASLVPVYLIARRLAGWAAAGLAAAIYALLPVVVHFNQEARPYSLSALVAGLLTLLVLRGVDGRTIGPWLAYGVVGAVGLYIHPFLAFVIAAHGAWLLVSRYWPGWRRATAAAVPLAIGAAPMPWVLLENAGAQEWIPELSGPVARTALVDLAGSAPLLLAMSVILAYGLVTRPSDRRAWLLIASVVLPIAGAAAVSLVKPMFIGRYFIVVLPPMAVFLAWTITGIRPRALAAGVALGLAALLVVTVPSAYRDVYGQDWRAAGAWVAAQAAPGDVMIAGSGRRSLSYYVNAAGAEPPHSTRVALVMDDPAVKRIWVAVLGDQTASSLADVPKRLSGAFEVAEQRPFGTYLSILLLTRRTAG